MNGSRWGYAAAAALMLMTGCSVDRAGGNAAEDVTTLTFAQPNDSAPPPQLLAWADQVARLTDRSVEIAFENGWRKGEVDYEAETLEDVESGEVDVAWVGARVFDRMGVTSFQALLAPMLLDSHDLQRAVFEEGIPEEMLTGVEELDLVGVGVLPGPMFKVLGVDADFVTPEAFSGAVVGMQDSALTERTFETLGATAQAVPTSATLDGLNGYAQQLGSIAGNGYQADAQSVTGDLNLWPRPLVIVVGESVYDQLSEEQQRALGQASRLAMVDALVGASNEDEESAALLCDAGLAIERAGDNGLAAFQRALEPVYASLREDPTTAGYLDRIEALKQSIDAGPDVAACDGSNEASGAIPNGTYQGTITMADVEEVCEPADPTAAGFSGIPPEGLTLEIEVTGDRIVQSEFPPGRPELKEVGWTGTYRTYRDTLELLETGRAEPAALTWSLDGKRLQLSDWPFEECDGQVIWVSHPWVRVD
jgi:TRAP-type C4-dicarboxylate transport system substrate-binding protein